MSVLRTRVAGPVVLPDGSPAQDHAQVIFTLRSWDKAGNAVVMHGPIVARVIGGEIDVQLFRTQSGDRSTVYDVTYSYWSQAQSAKADMSLGQISLTGAGPLALADLLALPAPAPTVPDALAQALAAAAAAQGMVVDADAVHHERLMAEAAARSAGGDANRAALAADAAVEAVQVDYLRATVADLPTSGIATNTTAFVTTTGHYYHWSGSAWVDDGEGAMGRKANVADVGRVDDIAALRVIALRNLMRMSVSRAIEGADERALVRRTPERPLIHYADPDVLDVAWTLSGRTITVIAGRSVIASAGRPIYPRGAVTIPAVPSGRITGEARTLSYAGRVGFVQAAGGRLMRAQISNVVVRDAATTAILTAGTDYVAHGPSGSLTIPTVGVEDRAVLVDYDWSDVRYDIVEVDVNGSVYVKQGTARIRDAGEFLPRPTVGRTPLLIVRSTASEVTVRRYHDPRKAFVSAPWIAQRQRARRSMPNTLAALSSGDPVIIAGYGDSRTAVGGTGETPYVPNGTRRDRATALYMEAQSADFLASIPLYDHGDGLGVAHTRIGWNWDLLRAFQQRYSGRAHQYLNFGIAGSTSGPEELNGTYPARLAGLTASGATLAVIAFGANEQGSSSIDTTANLVVIGEACRAANIDPVFMGLGMRNASNLLAFADATDRWITTSRRIAAAADYLDAPFVDMTPLFGADQNVGLLDARDLSGSNLSNHDGVYEMGLLGSALVSIILE